MGGDGWGWGEPRERQAHRGALVRCAPDRFERRWACKEANGEVWYS